MSNRDNFTGGFLAGTIVGGLVGAAIAVLLSPRPPEEISGTEKGNLPEPRPRKLRKHQLKGEERIELARASLEDKIAQLNEAIDDVRQQLSSVNGSPIERESSRRTSSDP